MSKKIREFSKAKEYLMAHSSSEMTPIELIGVIEPKEIKIVQIDMPFADSSLLDYSDDELTHEQLANITKYFMSN